MASIHPSPRQLLSPRHFEQVSFFSFLKNRQLAEKTRFFYLIFCCLVLCFSIFLFLFFFAAAAAVSASALHFPQQDQLSSFGCNFTNSCSSEVSQRGSDRRQVYLGIGIGRLVGCCRLGKLGQSLLLLLLPLLLMQLAWCFVASFWRTGFLDDGAKYVSVSWQQFYCFFICLFLRDAAATQREKEPACCSCKNALLVFKNYGQELHYVLQWMTS